MRRTSLALAAWLLCVLVASPAAGQRGGRRALPNYDGRPDPAPGADDVLLWVPRVLFAPLYFVSEYLVRRPLAHLGRRLPVFDVPRVSSTGTTHLRGMAILPTAFIEFGFKPSIGFIAYLNDVVARGTSFRLHGATWGVDWVKVAAIARFDLVRDVRALVVRFDGIRRRDLLFHGIGPESWDRPSRYAADRVDATLRFESRVGSVGDLTLTGSVRWVDFDDRGCCDEPTVGQRARAGELPYPPGYPSGYLVYRQGLDLSLDSRRPAPADGSGARASLHVEHDVDLDRPLSRRWVRWGGTLGAFADLTGQNRTLALWLYTLFVDALGEDAVPFTELAQAGGAGPMRGFRPGRLYDESAIALTSEYRWPVWHQLDGTIFLAAGNVFGRHLSGFALERCRLSFGLGLRSGRERDESLDFVVAFGTETIEDGAGVESFRLGVGWTRGF